MSEEYLKLFLQELGRISKLDKDEIKCSAYLFTRPSKTQKADRNAWKSGFHLYFNGISFSKEVKKRAYDELLKGIRGTELNRLLDTLTVGTLEEQLDFKPMNSNATFPMSSKPKGLSHKYAGRFDMTLRNRDQQFEIINFSKLIVTEFDLDGLLHAMPSLDIDRCKATSEYDVLEIDTSGDAINEICSKDMYESLLGLAKEDSPKAGLIIELINILPASTYATDHTHRIWLTNLIYYELDDTWTRYILRWYLNSVDNEDHGDEAHIDERIKDTINAGQRVGLNALKKRAREIDNEETSKIIEKYDINTIESIIMSGFRNSQSLRRATHDCASRAIYAVVGHNYHAVYNRLSVASSERLNYRFYYYDENAKEGPKYKKWHVINSLGTRLSADIAKHIIPVLDKLDHGHQQRIEELGEAEAKKKTSLLAKKTYIANTRAQFGEVQYGNCVACKFAEKVAQFSIDSKFGECLDQNLTYTGCYNGILESNMKTGEVSLHNGDNRHLFVSRSLGCQYNTDLNDNSPAVKELMGYWMDIFPDPDLLEFHILMRTATFLGGRGGKNLEIQIGTGSDGKTTINNGEDRALGNLGSTESKQSAYGTNMDPQILQCGKVSANGHDGGSAHIFGMRKISVSEPREENQYLDGAAVKKLLSNAPITLRDVGEKSRIGRIVAFIVLQTNVPLGFKHLNAGNLRRIHIVPFDTKFWDETTRDEFSTLKNAKRGTEDLNDERIISDEIAEAHLYYWIKYLKKFVTKYNGEIGSIERPTRILKLTKSIVQISSIIVQFIHEQLVLDVKSTETISLASITRAFITWYSNIVNGHNKYNNTGELMRLLSSSSLQKFIVDKHGIGLNSIDIMRSNPDDLNLTKYKFKRDESLESTL